MKKEIATPWRRGKAISYALTRTIYFKENTYFEFSVSTIVIFVYTQNIGTVPKTGKCSDNSIYSQYSNRF